jgi:hypothetical protein
MLYKVPARVIFFMLTWLLADINRPRAFAVIVFIVNKCRLAYHVTPAYIPPGEIVLFLIVL